MHELEAERGLVVAREGNEITVLTPAGEWHTLRWAGRLPEVGEEVMLPPISKSLPWKAVTAGVALILLLFLALPLARHALIPSGSGIPAYYISIDINPSIELVV
ncbi:MAG: anti-sigma factor domain-containing protein, partial [Moorella sp. (in: Bacteria)]|nr:anti-sigma factor domain-containing protein [Moorella sp. (in: firmicutes)]